MKIDKISIEEINKDGYYQIIWTDEYLDRMKLIYNAIPEAIRFYYPGIASSEWDRSNHELMYSKRVEFLFFNISKCTSRVVEERKYKEKYNNPNIGYVRIPYIDFEESYPDLEVFGPFYELEDLISYFNLKGFCKTCIEKTCIYNDKYEMEGVK